MKRTLLLIFFTVPVLFGGCSHKGNPPSSTQSTPTTETIGADRLQLQTQIHSAVQSKVGLTEVKNPNLELPKDIHKNQIKKYFRINNLYLALVLRSSMNFPLQIPDDMNPASAWVLVAPSQSKKWSKLIEIKDKKADHSAKNNPYYLWNDSGKLTLSVVDHNGAGSGEGVMKTFVTSDLSKWRLSGCHYFVADSIINSSANKFDYFSASTQLSSLKQLPVSECEDDVVINNSDI